MLQPLRDSRQYQQMWHQILGLLAVTLTAAILLRGWQAPRWAASTFCILGLIATVLFGFSTAQYAVQPVAGRVPTYTEQVAPQPGYDASWTKPHKQIRVEASAN
jgi:hypothetical protein